MGYDLSFGYNYGRQPYAYGVGGGNIQAHKSRAGDGRIRETATVQNGTPVGRPLRKTLASIDTWNDVELSQPFFSFAPVPATITEDYREGKGIYKKHGHAAVFYNKVVAVGAGVEFPTQIITQRRRWPTSVPIGQYWFFRDLWDEVIRAKILRKQPSYYSWDQLLHEWNGVTWYYCGLAEQIRSFAPLTYFAGLTAYPVDAIAFPLVWLGSFIGSMASHIYSMKKVGNHWLESVFLGNAAYKALIPNYVEMLLPQPEFTKSDILTELITPRLAKECLGPFGVTAMHGAGKMPKRYLTNIDYNIGLKAAAFARGLLEMNKTAYAFGLQGSFAPALFSQWSTYFAIGINTIWPLYDLIQNRGALRLAQDDREKDSTLLDSELHGQRARMLEGNLPKREMQSGLGITDAPKTEEEKARYLQELSAEECRELLRHLKEPAELLKLLSPQKVATILEAMLFSEEEIKHLVKKTFLQSLMKLPEGTSLDDFLSSVRAVVEKEAGEVTNLAHAIFENLEPEMQEKVLRSIYEKGGEKP